MSPGYYQDRDEVIFISGKKTGNAYYNPWADEPKWAGIMLYILEQSPPTSHCLEDPPEGIPESTRRSEATEGNLTVPKAEDTKYGVYENMISKTRFVHFTTGELPPRIHISDVLIETCSSMAAAQKAAGLTDAV